MCRYAAMNHKSGNESRQDATTYHKRDCCGAKQRSMARRAWRGTDDAGGGGVMSQIDRTQSDQSWPRCVENKRTAITRALSLFNETDARVVSRSCKPWR